MASDTSRRLMLLRHAKSDWPDVPDRDRPLAKRGQRDAPVIGRWLHDHGYQPQSVICSAALRTRQTWDLVAPELGGAPSVTFEPRAYAASAITLLYLVRELPADCRAALLIGHNPGVSELASALLETPADSAPGGAAPGGAASGDSAPGGAAPGGAASGGAAPGGGASGAGLPGSPGLRFPTAAVAILEFDGDWTGLSLAQARLVAYTSPGEL